MWKYGSVIGVSLWAFIGLMDSFEKHTGMGLIVPVACVVLLPLAMIDLFRDVRAAADKRI